MSKLCVKNFKLAYLWNQKSDRAETSHVHSIFPGQHFKAGFESLGPWLHPDIAKPRFREVGSGRGLHDPLLFRAESIGASFESVRLLVAEI